MVLVEIASDCCKQDILNLASDLKNKVTTQMWGDHFEYQTQETIYPNVFKFTTSAGTYVITIMSNKMNPRKHTPEFMV